MMMTSNTTQGTSTATVTTGTNFVADFTASTYAPSVHEAVSGSTTERIMVFMTASVNHTFTVPAGGLSCDILMIGGGGGGGFTGGGGGAGACIVAINQTLSAGSCVVNVGAGGENDSNGFDSFIFRVGDTGFRYLAKGGGGTQNWAGSGRSGGCGGGAGQNYNNGEIIEGPYVGGTAVSTNIVNGSTASIGPTITSTYAVLGYKGGDQLNTTQVYTQPAYTGAGGGGIGQGGFNHPNNDVNGAGGGNGRYFIDINGSQYNFRNYFANASTAFGVQDGSTGNYYIGGGGGGNGLYGSVKPSGGLGGGGQGNYIYSGLGPVANTTAGTANTGSGGGGGYGNGGNGSGGSGIVIIRYRSGTSITTYTHTSNLTTTLTTTLGTPSIELVRGTQGDSNTDYKIGNYNGDFIVKSSVSGVDTDYIRMLGTNGAIYNFTNSLYWTQTSDRRIKENIARASYDMCYDNIDKLELNRFNYIKEFNTGNKDTNQLGFIAQEIKEIFPKAVFTNNYNGGDLNIQDMLSIDIGQINYTLYGAVKKLMEINKDKEARLKRLEGLLNIEDSDGSSGNLLDTSNIAIDTSNLLDTSNITIDTSNIAIDTSNIAIDTSNILDTSNIAIDTSNIAIDSSNIVIESSNVVIDITPDDILSSNMNI